MVNLILHLNLLMQKHPSNKRIIPINVHTTNKVTLSMYTDVYNTLWAAFQCTNVSKWQIMI